MSDAITRVMLEAYKQDLPPTMFLSGQFQSPRRNFHNSEEVEFDIVRSDEEIAVAIQDLSAGARLNSADTFTNKSFKPPIYKEKGPINAHTLLQRIPGQDPFQAVDFQANAIQRGMDLSIKLQSKIIRSVEYQSSQVLTIGIVTLIDQNGAAVYSIDYKPKATHFPTAGVAWSSGSSTKLDDLSSLFSIVRQDGLNDVDMIIMGETSFELFIKDTSVLERFDNRRIAGEGIVPLERMGNGGIFRGVVEIGNYKVDIWTYNGRYKHPQTGVSTKYIPDEKVVVKSSGARMDATFGGIPRIGAPDPRIPAGLLNRVSIPGQMFDMQLNAWITNDGETMFVQAGTRPLMIPTAIDTYGCLDTGI